MRSAHALGGVSTRCRRRNSLNELEKLRVVTDKQLSVLERSAITRSEGQSPPASIEQAEDGDQAQGRTRSLSKLTHNPIVAKRIAAAATWTSAHASCQRWRPSSSVRAKHPRRKQRTIAIPAAARHAVSNARRWLNSRCPARPTLSLIRRLGAIQRKPRQHAACKGMQRQAGRDHQAARLPTPPSRPHGGAGRTTRSHARASAADTAKE